MFKNKISVVDADGYKGWMEAIAKEEFTYTELFFMVGDCDRPVL